MGPLIGGDIQKLLNNLLGYDHDALTMCLLARSDSNV